MKKLSHILVVLLLAITCGSYFLCAVFITPSVPANTTENAVKLPVVMYHLVLDDESRLGDFTVSPKMFEDDMEYILKNGYTPINFADLNAYVYDNKPLPKKPIMITFDDGFYNNYHYVFPIIKEKNVKIVLSVIGSLSEKYSKTNEKNPYYTYLTWDDLRTMHNSGLVEIQNHTYNLHKYTDKEKGVLKYLGETDEYYIKRIREDFEKNHKLIKENTGAVCTVMTFPFGVSSKKSEEIAKQIGYTASMSCVEGINYITHDKNCLYLIKRFNRKASYETEKFFNEKIF